MRNFGLYLVLLSAAIMGCAEDDQEPSGIPLPQGATYVTVSQVETPDGSSTVVAFTPELPRGELDLSGGLEIPGYAEVAIHDGSLYVGKSEALTVTRYDVAEDRLVERGTLGLQGQGLAWVNELFFVDSQHAYTVNSEQFRILEWDPGTMELVAEHDISALARDGWGNEYRGGYLRESDGVLFFIWAYTNDRKAFINDFIVGVFDTHTKRLEILVDQECPASAGFGGFFDESGDLYLPADSFGGFTYIGSADPKPACVRRIRAGERRFDSGYLMKPTDALGAGLAPWGLYYAGSGTVYTTAVDPARLANYDTVYELIFDPVHEGFTLNLSEATAQRVDTMPPDAVGFESVTIDGRALVPRSAGSVELYEIENVQTKVYALDGATNTATPQFTMAGYMGLVARLR